MTTTSPGPTLRAPALRLAPVILMVMGQLAAVCSVASAGEPDLLVPRGAEWRYLDEGTDPGPTWMQAAFDDSSWSVGPAQLGYGDGDQATTVSFGPLSSDKYITTHYRHAFNVVDASAYDGLHLQLVRDDGARVFLNGTEVVRSNLPGGVLSITTPAASTIFGSDEDASVVWALDPADLLTGTNQLAVELHQRSATSSDTSFDLELLASSGSFLDRGPYLQLGTPTSMVVRWRTVGTATTRVFYGSSPGLLNMTADGFGPSLNHIVTLSGLTPDSTYYYQVGTIVGDVLAGVTPFSFDTAPVAGTRTPFRIWAVGDSGSADLHAMRVRDAYTSFTGATNTDVWLMLGDNAYNSGLETEYQDAVFELYTDELAGSVVWPTRGNHDMAAVTYFGVFNMPSLGEAGGTASMTEAYYSFDYGNVHFVCLDSQGSSRSVGGPMWLWAQTDLMNTDQDWIIAYWHHPPYTMGSHNSDTELQLADMRENLVPLLEDHGVDLVVCGHSHSYERSYLIDGHHGTSDTFTGGMLLDGGDGDPSGDGPYVKQAGPAGGAVFAVPGSSGKLSSMEPAPHPVMHVAVEELGSLVLDVDSARITGRFITDGGAVIDTFVLEQVFDDTWADLGLGLAGSVGTPLLSGNGSLMPDGPLTTTLTGAPASSIAFLVIGLSRIDAPLLGGVLVPDLFTPPGRALPIPTDLGGGFTLASTWPTGVPAQFPLYLQAWVVDGGSPVGFAASNGLAALTP